MPSCVCNHRHVCEINAVYRGPVCAFLYVFNSDLISSKHLPVGQEIVLEFRVYYTSRSSKAEPRKESDKSVRLWESNPSHSIHHSCSEYSNTTEFRWQYELINHKSVSGLAWLILLQKPESFFAWLWPMKHSVKGLVAIVNHISIYGTDIVDNSGLSFKILVSTPVHATFSSKFTSPHFCLEWNNK